MFKTRLIAMGCPYTDAVRKCRSRIAQVSYGEREEEGSGCTTAHAEGKTVYHAQASDLCASARVAIQMHGCCGSGARNGESREHGAAVHGREPSSHLHINSGYV